MQEKFRTSRAFINSLSLRVQQTLFALMTYLLLLVICLLAVSPEQYDLSVGDVAPKTITASRDIIDEITTDRRRQAAAAAVSMAGTCNGTSQSVAPAQFVLLFKPLITRS